MLLDEITSDINILNEKCVIYGSNLNIQIDLDIGRNYGPSSAYFKCANSNSYGSAKKEARIGIYEPIYIIHRGEKRSFKLKDTDKENLIRLLQSNATDYRGTNWQKLISLFNTRLGYSEKEQLAFSYEDYKNGKRSGNLIPFDLPMPDYTKL